MGLTAQVFSQEAIGWFRIFATPPGGDRVEVTMFRGAPTVIQTLSTADPFGDSVATINFPQITIFDRPGQGDLYWLVPYVDIDIIWENTEEYDYHWEWEGFMIDESYTFEESDSGLTIELKGALYQADNFLARPFFPQQPVPYEILIRDALNPATHPGLRTAPLRVEFPSTWAKIVPEFDQEAYLWFLKPWGVTPGQKWTGLTTRLTGSWDPTLTSFVQGLLMVMFEEGGDQWTIRKDRGRQPVLFLRRVPRRNDPDLLTIELGTPGVTMRLSRDFTQHGNVIFGSGSDSAGVSFSGAEISNDGTTTEYEPFAALPSVHPTTSNPRYNPNLQRKEVKIDFPQGMDELTARDVAFAQLNRFADPGFTGQITLRTDPNLGDMGLPFPRMLIRAGQPILVKGLRGQNVLFHITEASIDLMNSSATLTVDTKFRDQLTVQEVRERTRDALTPMRLLKPGDFSVTTQDLLRPWSYAEGSGCLPLGATEFFTKRVPNNARFPWQEWTRRFPPKHYPSFYIQVTPPDYTRSENNWARYNGSYAAASFPIRMAASGSIRLSQIAAYDADGNVLPVQFHVSVYSNQGVTIRDMPLIPTAEVRIRKPVTATYQVGEANPFFDGAFEKIRPDGSEQDDGGYTSHESVGFQMGWGNYYEPAGYSPGLASRGAPRTGLLEDERLWNFDTTAMPGFDRYNPANNPWNSGAGMMYLMLYCDDHPAGQPVYFLGRLFRSEAAQ